MSCCRAQNSIKSAAISKAFGVVLLCLKDQVSVISQVINKVAMSSSIISFQLLEKCFISSYTITVEDEAVLSTKLTCQNPVLVT